MNEELDTNEEPVKLKGRALGIVALIIGIPIFLLSGLCTGFFSLDLLRGTSADLAVYVSLWEVLVIGAFGCVPAALLTWAGWRLLKRGPNKTSTIIILLNVGLIALVIAFFLGAF